MPGPEGVIGYSVIGCLVSECSGASAPGHRSL